MSTTGPSSVRSSNAEIENTPGVANGGENPIAARIASFEAQISPRVSSAGTDEVSGSKKEQSGFNSQNMGQEPDYSAPGLDSLHWAGVKKRGDYDQRSVASSMAAEKDDKSIYEEPAVGAVEGGCQ